MTTKKTELTFEESIDQALEILQQLRQKENNNAAFILTASQDDPTTPSSILVSCVATGPITNQLNGLAQYVASDSRIMPVLEKFYKLTK
jgi:hypothetical protein|nr:MAG TPA: hypothetical protein [Caudoviricetes sp.]